MELLEAKICAMICLILGSMLVGLIPAWFSSYSRNSWPLFLSSMLCLGGGVLLSTSLVHMLPEIREHLGEYSEYTELMFCAGFFALYLIDEVVHYFFGNTHTSRNETTRQRPGRQFYGSTEVQPLVYSQQTAYNPHYLSERDACQYNLSTSQMCHLGHTETCHNAPVSSYGLLVALSIHAVLEGLAVGLESVPTQVLLLLGAIASHKLVVGFCLGVELSSAGENTALRHFISITIFSCGTPLGIALGMFISNVPANIVEIILPILQCLAGGTLLYVSVSEVLPRERARWHQQNTRKLAGMCQFFSVLTGFIIMTLLTKFMDH